MQKEAQKILKHRVITLLDRRELEFLDKLGKDALFSTGHKLSYTEILRALIDFSMQIGLSANKVGSSSALRQRILQCMRDLIIKEKATALKIA